MARYRIDSIADLSRQMAFTPADVRLGQVAAAEDLLLSIDPHKAYPLEFVVFRITGYHPKAAVDQGLLTGLALQHDLGLLIEQVSDSLDVQIAALSEPVLTIEDVAGRFSVTSKTIQRWRRRGLPARRFVFADGKRRVGFLLSSVERFLRANRDQVVPDAATFQVDRQDQERILCRARRLAEHGGCCLQGIVRRVARRTNRSPLTVLHIIRKHNLENPDLAIIAAAPADIGPDERARMVRRHRRGVPLGLIASRLGRPRSVVYRVVLEERVVRLARRRVRFFDDPLYHQPDAAAVVEALVAQDALPEPSASTAEQSRVPRGLPVELAELYREPLLTPALERALFLKLGFHKMQFVHMRRRLDVELARARDLTRMEQAWQRATETRSRIVRANLRLVVSVARKHLRTGLSLAELMSEGTLTLMRAVDGFDVHRGYRFSTYATLALMKGFARRVPQMRVRQAGSVGDQVLSSLPDRRSDAGWERMVHREAVGRLLGQLDDRERFILQRSYGLGDTTPATYEQLARGLGLPTLKVRQIERAALAKLRSAAKAV
jgi:RNA polymerase sigma factor (sigma-70 family)